MKPFIIKPHSTLRGLVEAPGDKSISHRAAILSSLTRRRTIIRNFSFCQDCLVTLKVLKSVGVKLVMNRRAKTVVLVGPKVFHSPKRPLDMQESGTSARVLLGFLVGQSLAARISGSKSLRSRPMKRVIEPLRLMGAHIKGRRLKGGEYLPLTVCPASLSGIRWKQQVASAQVKSAILLAGLGAVGTTVVSQRFVSRDHTERMLKAFDADILITSGQTQLRRRPLKSLKRLYVPGDISGAAFFIVAALITKHSKIRLKKVSINPTRSGILNVLKRMGGDIRILKRYSQFEPMADIEVKSASLKGTVVRVAEVPNLIDELPILMVAAACAKGLTVIQGVGELRVKETDRIHSMEVNLKKLGCLISVKKTKKREDIVIRGVAEFKGARLKSFGDHRTAMSVCVAGLRANQSSILDDTGCMNKSFPDFLTIFKHLLARE